MNTQPRSIWENIKMIVQGVADAAASTTHAVGTVADTADEIAKAGHVMAKNNREIVEIESEGKKTAKMEALAKEFPKMFETVSIDEAVA